LVNLDQFDHLNQMITLSVITFSQMMTLPVTTFILIFNF
jgi:hypothetical protein